MGDSLRVVIADDDKDTLEMYQMLLSAFGHTVVGNTANGRELVRLCAERKPDLALIDVRMPIMDGIHAADEIVKVAAMPIILISGTYEESAIERGALSSVMAYLIKPVTADGLRAAIAVATRRFKELQQAVEESRELRQTLQDRKIIERAKGILMQRAGLSEQEAFKRLQKLSWDTNQKMVKVAETLLMAEEAVMPFEARPNSADTKAQGAPRRVNHAHRQHNIVRDLRTGASGQGSPTQLQ